MPKKKPKPKLNLEVAVKVKQIIETDVIECANELLKNGDWILLNSYKNNYLSDSPIMRLGRIADL